MKIENQEFRASHGLLWVRVWHMKASRRNFPRTWDETIDYNQYDIIDSTMIQMGRETHDTRVTMLMALREGHQKGRRNTTRDLTKRASLHSAERVFYLSFPELSLHTH
jgi:hypothetical protein